MAKQRIMNIILAVLLVVFILSLAITVTLNFRPLYTFVVDDYNLPLSTGMSREAIIRQYDVLISYNNIGGPAKLDFPDLPASETGLIHFEEVRKIFLVIQWALIVSAVILSASLALSPQVRSQRQYLKYAGIFALVFPVALSIFVVALWDRVFVWFHELFFDNDYWIFDGVTDPIINLLPDKFFMYSALMILAICLIGGAICLGIHERGKEHPKAFFRRHFH